jgi:hypothetical protein
MNLRKYKPEFDQLDRRDVPSGIDLGGVHIWDGNNITVQAGVLVTRHGRFIANPADNLVTSVTYDLVRMPRQTLPLDFTTNTFTLSHTYTKPGLYYVYVSILDTTNFGFANSLNTVTVRSAPRSH